VSAERELRYRRTTKDSQVPGRRRQNRLRSTIPANPQRDDIYVLSYTLRAVKAVQVLVILHQLFPYKFCAHSLLILYPLSR